MDRAAGRPAPLVEDDTLRDFLRRVSSDPDLELEWIDLLSQLEYVGCRKIVKGVAFENVSLDILRHVSEESSHAFLLKSVVEEGGVRGRSWKEGRFAEAGWGYFQRLDHAISALPASESLRYPGVSWAIERRVLVVYPAYLKVTRNEALQRALRRILAQEERHGEQFDAVVFPDGYPAAVAEIEDRLWAGFLAGVTPR
ncbi:MAG TPA: ferritin-like domain-containing protein [Planctomycetota bacterium]|nr:ferritin-like domain-containing protein [Planctomycetota bacterium]